MSFIRNTYRLIALMMAFLMFFTSMGFAMDMHFCQGKLKSVSFFGEAKTCHDMAENATKSCPHHKKMAAEKKGCSEDKNCCSNKTVYFQSDQDQQIQNADYTIGKQLQQFVIAYVAAFIANDFEVEYEVVPYAHYKPPLIQKDIPILNQSFLL